MKISAGLRKILFLLLFPLVLFCRKWTTLVYMAADNDLAQWADSDLVEMEAVGSTDDFAIIVQVDKPYIGARRLLIKKGGNSQIADLGITDMCNWQTLSDFLVWGITNYPADRYLVILWDHGTGWSLAPRRTFGNDWSGGSRLSISNGDFQKAVSTAYDYTGEKIDILAFDACLMQQTEVVYEVKNYVRMFLASQAVCPLQGFKYDGIFEVLRLDPGIDEFDLAEKIVEVNVEYYADIQPVTYSAIAAEKLTKLKQSGDDLFSSLLEGLPAAELMELRETVQTIPSMGLIPHPEDELVDFGDFINALHKTLKTSMSEALMNIYNDLIIVSDYRGSDFARTTGLTIWFPYRYLEFKQMYDYYKNLEWSNTLWVNFLNWFYGEDDINPTAVSLSAGKVGNNNDFSLSWSGSHDLAPVTYSIIETKEIDPIFEDLCEDSSKWNFDGFSLSSDNPYSGSYSFFSGNESNLKNSIETKEMISLNDYGLLTVYLSYNTEEKNDSLIIEFGNLKDVHYGVSEGWRKRTLILPAGSSRLKISYHTNGAMNKGGVYIDDVKIEELKYSCFIRNSLADTALYIFNKLKGEYYYMVRPEDRYGNTGNLSNSVGVSLKKFARPYSKPAPFRGSCDIILDYPDSLNPTVEIFSITGRLVKRFTPEMINNRTVHWNGKDMHNKEVGSGLYFVLLNSGSFKKLGKIARQR
ncbi:MAG TPA: hypothetical protein ENI34_04110 [candidate division WOR-3 bacterium]|uniref:T9SS type A sorting domain-containing protein n=1 Tax=candidate division WOR-3 bacterium TaxID=2052148 RepID=A0A9C9JZN7_UNCW3|nr:hypothetical protein [candidate division WOR-3 bacterium]